MGATKIDFTDTIAVIGAAVFTSLLSEGVSYLLFFRTQEYKNLQKEIDLTTKKIEKQKEESVDPSKMKKHDKRLQVNEAQLKEYNSEMSRIKMKSTFLVALFMMIFVSLMSNNFQGVVVAKLPFEPFSLVRSLTHRGLMGSDYTNCAMIFLYILSNVTLRPILQKILGTAGPRTAQNSFFANNLYKN